MFGQSLLEHTSLADDGHPRRLQDTDADRLKYILFGMKKKAGKLWLSVPRSPKPVQVKPSTAADMLGVLVQHTEGTKGTMKRHRWASYKSTYTRRDCFSPYTQAKSEEESSTISFMASMLNTGPTLVENTRKTWISCIMPKAKEVRDKGPFIIFPPHDLN